MKSYRNLKEVQRKETIGRRLSLSGLAVLFFGTMASFGRTWYPPETVPTNAVAAFLQNYGTLLSLLALPAGVLLASIGSYFTIRYARRYWPGIRTMSRPDEVVERSMKGFDDKFVYFAHSLPKCPYVLAGPCGVLLFAVRIDRGRIVINGDRWREPFSLGRLITIFAREGLGNPPQELQDQTKQMRALLDKAGANGENSPSQFASVPIDGAAIFLNDDAQLEINSATIPVLRADQIKEFVRRKAKDAKLAPEKVRALTDYLREQSTYQEEEP